MGAGRPPLFKSVEDLKSKVKDYFAECEKEKTPLTITGIALFLGFESRQSFYDYEKIDEFSYTIKRARLKVEHAYEKNLHQPNCTGSLFALKNFGWSDRQEVDHTTAGEKINIISLGSGKNPNETS